MRRSDIGAGEGKPGSKDSREEAAPRNRNSKSSRGDPGSGSDIIQPVPLTGSDSDRFIARVETLTGYGEAAEWALCLRADLELWRTGDLAWEEMSTKLLLAGPPGTGKTTFARALCNSLQIPLLATSVATWLEPGYFGDVLKRMRATFEEAESMRPAILFIDELDGIGIRRQRGEWVEYTNGIINRALELLDGAIRSSGVIVVAATNHVAMIDPALLRSGRLEKHIEIPPPDTEALVGIIRHHLKDDLDRVVASAPSQVGEGLETTRTAIAEASVDQATRAGSHRGDPEAATENGAREAAEAADAAGPFATATTDLTKAQEPITASQEVPPHGEV